MARHRRRRILSAAGAVIVLALVVAGCGRRLGAVADGDPAAGGSVPPSATVAPSGTPIVARPGPTSDATELSSPGPSPATSTAPRATQAPPPPPAATPGPVPLAPPDLSAIDQLLDELDAALGADATADTDEGSAP